MQLLASEQAKTGCAMPSAAQPRRNWYTRMVYLPAELAEHILNIN